MLTEFYKKINLNKSYPPTSAWKGGAYANGPGARCKSLQRDSNSHKTNDNAYTSTALNEAAHRRRSKVPSSASGAKYRKVPAYFMILFMRIKSTVLIFISQKKLPLEFCGYAAASDVF